MVLVYVTSSDMTRFEFFTLLLVLPYLFHVVTSDHVRIETEAGRTFDAVCPSKHYVSGLKIDRVVNTNTNETDFEFTVDCDSFFDNVADDTGSESCQVLLPIPMLYFDLRWDDLERNCDCNEYLAGIRSGYFGDKWAGNIIGRERRIQLVCCRANNRRLNSGQCGYTGQESLLAPWLIAEIGTARLGANGRPGVIQSISLLNGYINSRVCDWTPNTGTHVGDFDTANGCYEEIRCSRGANETKRCYNSYTETWGWSNPMIYSDGAKVAVLPRTGMYQKQEHVCKSGQRVVSFRKFKLNSDSKYPDPDYAISVVCGDNGGVYPCFCYWLDYCPTSTYNQFYGGKHETWYLAGMRSSFDNGLKQRRVEMLCCKTNALKLGNCSTSPQVSDSRQKFDVDVPPNKKATFIGKIGEETIQVIRNVAVTYAFDILGFKFTTCTAELTYDWCDDGHGEPCYRCQRRPTNRPIVRDLPAPRPPTGRQGGDGWGPIWFNRPGARPAPAPAPGTVSRPGPGSGPAPRPGQGHSGNSGTGHSTDHSFNRTAGPVVIAPPAAPVDGSPQGQNGTRGTGKPKGGSGASTTIQPTGPTASSKSTGRSAGGDKSTQTHAATPTSTPAGLVRSSTRISTPNTTTSVPPSVSATTPTAAPTSSTTPATSPATVPTTTPAAAPALA